VLTQATAATYLESRLYVWAVRLYAGGLLGYLFFDRAFAWVHVPGLPLFYGEFMLGSAVLLMLATVAPLQRAWREASTLRILGAFMAWGALLFPSGFLVWRFDAVRDSALWYYGIAGLFAAYLIARTPDILERAMDGYGRIVIAIAIWLPTALFANAAFDDLPILVPDSGVSVLSHKPGNIAVHAAMAVIALFTFLDTPTENLRFRGRRAGFTALLTSTVVFAGIQNRAGLLAGLLGLAWLTFALPRRRRPELLLASLGILVAVAAVSLVFDLRLDVFGNDREVSVQGFAENVASITAPSDASTQRGNTSNWRLDLWGRVLRDVSADSPATGLGFGENIRDRYGEQDEDPPARGPHNSHVNVFARMGGVGFALWFLLWAAWFASVGRSKRRFTARGQDRFAGLALWLMISVAMTLLNAFFDPTMEGPQVATWTWTLFGVGAALPMFFRSDTTSAR
jgi:hypothetical protein